MVFQRGVAANPKGRGVENHARLARDLLGPHAKRAAAEIVAQLDSDKNSDRQWAVEMIFNYVCGKPKESIDISGQIEHIAISVIAKKDELLKIEHAQDQSGAVAETAGSVSLASD